MLTSRTPSPCRGRTRQEGGLSARPAPTSSPFPLHACCRRSWLGRPAHTKLLQLPGSWKIPGLACNSLPTATAPPTCWLSEAQRWVSLWAWVFPRDDQHLTSLRAPGLGSFTGCSLEAGEDLTVWSGEGQEWFWPAPTPPPHTRGDPRPPSCLAAGWGRACRRTAPRGCSGQVHPMKRKY